MSGEATKKGRWQRGRPSVAVRCARRQDRGESYDKQGKETRGRKDTQAKAPWSLAGKFYTTNLILI